MKLEYVLDENLELQDRVLDLVADIRALRETLHACVGGLHRSQVQLARYQYALTELRGADRRFGLPAEAA